MNKIIIILTAVLGVILLVAGAVLHWLVVPNVIHNRVKDEMQLRNGTDEFDLFKKLPVPLQWKMTYFRINNAKEFDTSKDVMKLNYSEIGPFVYDEYREKYDIEFSKDGSSVTYREKRNFIFNQKLSGKNHFNDTIMMVSPLFGVVGSFLKALSAKGPEHFPGVKDHLKSIATPIGAYDIAFGKLPWMMYKNFFNNTEAKDPIQVVDTGKHDISKLYQYINYDKSINGTQDVWNKSGSCNDIKGTDAVQFKPFLTENDVIYAFEPMLCRSIKFAHDPKVMKSVSVKGIDTIRYYATDDNFARTVENMCYCTEKDLDMCPADLVNLNNCGASAGIMDMLVSTPYFYPFTENLKNTTMLPPLPMSYENYGTYLDIEPLSGVVLNAKKRLQLYIQLKNNSVGTGFLDGLKSTYGKAFVPIMIIEESGQIDNENAQKLKDKVLTPKKVATISLIATMSLGGLLLLIAGGCAFFNR